MRNAAAADQFDGLGDELVGDEGELHELELEDLDGWEDETTVGDPVPEAAPSTTTTPPPAKKAAPKKTTTRKGGRR